VKIGQLTEIVSSQNPFDASGGNDSVDDALGRAGIVQNRRAASAIMKIHVVALATMSTRQQNHTAVMRSWRSAGDPRYTNGRSTATCVFVGLRLTSHRKHPKLKKSWSSAAGEARFRRRNSPAADQCRQLHTLPQDYLDRQRPATDPRGVVTTAQSKNVCER